ncbi:hypothetical protein [Micromonospora auratinigra]|uniref:DUF4276 family protein n=1 Tax=Micromonospora auratinigra TaxID=261654 RepID=A0A1A8ZML5_9ACTN|nr:hypothetical protein [Micromonospora auratinigra]SBT45107.1 Domain of unknown function (DUF4276) [Micromonospora auratinigra]
MTQRSYSGLFVAEGSSDAPLAELIESLFLQRGVDVRLSQPDFSLLGRVAKDVGSRVSAGLRLAGEPADLIVVHRDADNAGHAARRQEIVTAVSSLKVPSALIPVIPVRMTEAWLLLDEAAIRLVAGNPKGRMNLTLPKRHEVESLADPKNVLRTCLLTASGETGRRGDAVRNRFNQHRRQLLELLDPSGPVSTLQSWKRLLDEVDHIVAGWEPYRD